MTPTFSRRLAPLMNSAFMLAMGDERRERFVERVTKKDSFSELSDTDQKLVLEAEKSLERKESPWDLK